MATGWVSAAPLQKEMGRNTQVVPVLSVRTGILRPQGWVSRLHGSSSVPAGGVLVLAGLEFGLCRDLPPVCLICSSWRKGKTSLVGCF